MPEKKRKVPQPAKLSVVQRKAVPDGDIQPTFRDQIAVEVITRLVTDRLIETRRKPDFHRLVDVGYTVADTILERR